MFGLSGRVNRFVGVSGFGLQCFRFFLHTLFRRHVTGPLNLINPKPQTLGAGGLCQGFEAWEFGTEPAGLH